MQISLNDEQFRNVFQKTILDGMTEEQRSDVIAQALAYLTTPQKKDGYGYANVKSTSPLEDAFRSSMENVARTMIQEEVKTNPQIRELVSKVVTEGVTQLLAKDYSELGSALAEKIEQVFRDRS